MSKILTILCLSLAFTYAASAADSDAPVVKNTDNGADKAGPENKEISGGRSSANTPKPADTAGDKAAANARASEPNKEAAGGRSDDRRGADTGAGNPTAPENKEAAGGRSPATPATSK